MKNKLMLLLILVVLFAGFVFIRYFIFDKSNEYGKLNIISSPEASIFINNTIIGKTPYDDKYKIGEYLLKLIPEGTSTETASWNGKIKVYKNAMTYVNRELGSSDITSAGEVFTTEKIDSATRNDPYGEVYVETEPQGAIVTLDSDEKGTAPLILSSVLKGEHELSVYMPGFFRRTEKINVDSGYRVNASFKLALDPTQQKLEDKTKVSSDSAKTNATVTIGANEQGWLRVRIDSSIDATEEAKVKVGEKYELLDEKTGWYKIKFNDNNDGLVSGQFNEGWISSEYSTKE